MNRKFTEIENRTALNHMEKCLTSFITKEMQIKSTIRPFLPIRWAKIQSLTAYLIEKAMD